MSELHLRVYTNRSELILPDGTVKVFSEGGMNQATRVRYQKIARELANDYLEKQILICRDEAFSHNCRVETLCATSLRGESQIN